MAEPKLALPLTRRRFLRILLSLGGVAAIQVACGLPPEFAPLLTPTPASSPGAPAAQSWAPPPTLMAKSTAVATRTLSPTSSPTATTTPTRTATPTLVPIDLEAWLRERPNIASALVWRQIENRPQVYSDWSTADKTQLAACVEMFRRGTWTGVPAEPPLAVQPAPTETAVTRLAPDVAFLYFTAYAGFGLAAEIERWVPWSLMTFTKDELAMLFDSRWLYLWDTPTKSYVVYFTLGNATPGDPLRTFGFLQSNKMIGATARETIGRLLDWCRDNLRHFLYSGDAANVYQHWQYYGSPPVEKMISGTISGVQPAQGKKNWTAGCWGTTGFLRAVLRTVNIPVKLEMRGGHALPSFMREGLYLSHGDDPYDRFSVASPPIPIDELLIDSGRFDAWFGPGVSEETRTKNIGRQPRELALEYLPDYLLYMYCSDSRARKSHTNGEVYSVYYKDLYSLEDLEARGLFDRMDAKIAAAGGCHKIPPR